MAQLDDKQQKATCIDAPGWPLAAIHLRQKLEDKQKAALSRDSGGSSVSLSPCSSPGNSRTLMQQLKDNQEFSTTSTHAAGESPFRSPSSAPKKPVPEAVDKLMQQLADKHKAKEGWKRGRGRTRELLSRTFRRHSSCPPSPSPEPVVSIVSPTGSNGTEYEIACYDYVKEADWWNAPLFREYKQRSLRSATQNYVSQIGVGGYSNVYHGMLPDGTHVAVKVTTEQPNNSSSSSEDHSFTRWFTELKLARKCEHKNVLRVLGYSYQKKKYSRVLSYPLRKNRVKLNSVGDLEEPASPFKGMQVLEFMENGDLAAVLESPDCDMGWSRRLEVLIGAATGLAHIHSQGVVHRDIKPANIFLDENFCPKIGDFGLSRLMTCFPDSPIPSSSSSAESFSPEEWSGSEQGDSGSPSYDITAARGTIGYLDPDYLSTGVVTCKADVFSFGVTILNVVSGKKAFELADLEGDNRAKALLLEGRALEIVDARLDMSCQKLVAQTTNVIRIAFLCMQRSPLARPRMEQVVALLEAVRDSDTSSSDLLEDFWEEFMKSRYDFVHDVDSLLHQQWDLFKSANSTLSKDQSMT